MSTIADLEAKIGRLMQENEALREALCGREAIYIPAEWRLSGMEFKMMTLLAGPAQITTKESMYSFLYSVHEEIGPKVMDVMVCKIRKKLTPFGVSIRTHYGRGWELDNVTKEKLRFGPGGLHAIGRISESEMVRRILNG